MSYTVKDFTLEEKLKLLSGKNSWCTEDFNGKLYEVVMSDGPVGVRKVMNTEEKGWHEVPAVAYPACEVLSQTWDVSLAYQMGASLADDCIERGVDILLAPGVNIKRSPLCGRNFEYFSEDPLVAGTLAREYIKGLEDKHVGTCLKHYCANNSEYGRIWTSSEVDERTLREIYLQPFRIACEANPSSVMSSYNLVNGERMSAHKKLYDLLRKELWREDGAIISDWGAVQDEAASVRAGLDIKMPYKEGSYEVLKGAYERGEITDEQIDACVARVLALIARCEEASKRRKVESTEEERREIAEKIAREGIVLLKNNGVLPLKNPSSVHVTGAAPQEYYCGRGSSCIRQHAPVLSLQEALQERLPNATIAVYDTDQWSGLHCGAFEGGYGKDVSIVVCGDFEREDVDRQTMKLPWEDEMMIDQVASRNPNTVVVLRCGAAVDVSAWLDKVAAVVWAGYGGERGNEALADILLGKANPSGKLTETFARCYEDYPVAHTVRTHVINVYSEGLDVGYRYFDKWEDKVVFPFGFGLSYSSFAYSNLQVEEESEGYRVRFWIENTSKVEGAEVAQLYVREVNPRVYRPVKELKGFAKVTVGAGEKRQVEIFVEKRAFGYYSTATDGWKTNAGAYEILVGKNTRDICLKATVTLK